MIEVKELTKTFGGMPALRGLSMHVGRGSIYGLVGPNGAGKTTLLHHVAGVMRPDSGTILVDGSIVFENPQVKANIAYVPSDFYFYRQARVVDMRELYAQLFGHFNAARFDELAAEYGLASRRMVRSLSKGMQKQLAICLSLARTPDVLLLDEPLDGLDPAVRRSVLGRVMDEVYTRQMTVVVSSHNLRELTDVCDYVGIMEAGHMRLERGLEDLQSGFAKVQVAFDNGSTDQPQGLEVLHREVQGRLQTLVVRGAGNDVERTLDAQGATFVNVLPLSLEEIFIYELGGTDHDAH